MKPSRRFPELTISIAGKVGRLEQFEGYFASAKNIMEKIVLYFPFIWQEKRMPRLRSVGREPHKVIPEVGCDTTRPCSTSGSAGCCGQI